MTTYDPVAAFCEQLQRKITVIDGMRIIESLQAVERTDKPIRVHEMKRWMRPNYHQRIQKKWNKRFGFVMKPMAYKVGGMGFVCHPTIVAKLIEEAGQ